MSERNKITTDFVGKYESDFYRISELASRHDISRSEVMRKAAHLALSWNKTGFIERVKRCFFHF